MKLSNFLIFLSVIFFSATPMSKDLYYDKLSRHWLEKTAEKLAQECHIEFLSSQTGTMIDCQEVVWCVKYLIQHPLTIDEMRPIAQGLFKAFWHLGQTEPSFNEYTKAVNITYKSEDVLNPNMFGLKIVFWDKEMNRPLYPNLAQVVVKESKIFYYYADPKTWALQEPSIVEDLPKQILRGQK